jgi:hypothetical protein
MGWIRQLSLTPGEAALLLRNADVVLGEDEVRGAAAGPRSRSNKARREAARRSFADQTPSADWMTGHGEAVSISR